MEHHHDELLAARGERAPQRLELLAPSNERDLARRGDDARTRAFEPRDDLLTGRALPGLGHEQVHGQMREVLGHAVEIRGGRQRRSLLLREEDRGRRAVERQPPRERLVEDDAHRIPVGGGRGAQERGLLGRHVGRRSGERVVDAVPRAIGKVGRDPEVEEHHAPLARDDHVRRLHVPVELACRVDCTEAGGELPKGVTEARDVADRELLHGGRGVRVHRGHPRFARARLQRIEVRRTGEHCLVQTDTDPRAEEWRGRRHRQRRVHPGHEIDAVDQLHREEPPIVLAEELVQLDHVRMADVGQGAELALEAEQGLRVEVNHGLERHGLAAHEIARAMDDPHAACPQATIHLESLRSAKTQAPLHRPAPTPQGG